MRKSDTISANLNLSSNLWRGLFQHPLFFSGALIVAAWAQYYSVGHSMNAAGPFIAYPIWLILSTRSSWRRYSAVYLVFIGSCLAAWNGVIEDEALSVIVVSSIGTVMFLPFLILRLAFERINRGLRHLLFPSTIVVVEWLLSLLSPYGSFGSIAYSQWNNSILLQSASIGGLAIVSFMIGWFASVVADLLDHRPGRPVTGTGLAFLAVVILLTFLGMYRLSSGERVKRIRMASVVVDIEHMRGPVLRRILLGEASDTDLIRHEEQIGILHDTLLSETEKEAHAGALLVSWAEGNAQVFAGRESLLIERARETARRLHIYLLVSPGVIHSGKNQFDLDAVLIDPQGEVLGSYKKQTVVPGDTNVAGGHDLPVIPIEFGRAGIAICFDADFPDLLNPLTEGMADFLLLPSSDWAAITPFHSRMSAFRAVEQGVSLLRPVYAGRSMAFDPYGNVIAENDFFESENRNMVANLPVKRQFAVGGTGSFLMRLLAMCITLANFFSLVATKRDERPG